ncbi:hypothetical protein ACFX11_015035 [Malus domestica]
MYLLVGHKVSQQDSQLPPDAWNSRPYFSFAACSGADRRLCSFAQLPRQRNIALWQSIPRSLSFTNFSIKSCRTADVAEDLVTGRHREGVSGSVGWSSGT